MPKIAVHLTDNNIFDILCEISCFMLFGLVMEAVWHRILICLKHFTKPSVVSLKKKI